MNDKFWTTHQSHSPFHTGHASMTELKYHNPISLLPCVPRVHHSLNVILENLDVQSLLMLHVVNLSKKKKEKEKIPSFQLSWHHFLPLFKTRNIQDTSAVQ